MNSSGIKRGLAASAIGALAVTGVPALAGTASAEAGDEIVFVSAGPTLNHGDVGGEVRVKLKGITEAELDSDLDVFNAALTGSPNTPSQTVTITDPSYKYVANGDQGDSNKNDGYAEATVLVALDTPADGNTASYALVINDDNDGNVAATEARTQVSQQTSGALSKIVVAPASQSAPQNQNSGDYTVTLQDAAGRTTQLKSGEVVDLTPSSGTVTPSDTQFDEFELADGTQAFTATGTTVGSYDIAIDSPDYTGEQTKATLVVTKAATITAGDLDIVTAADTWNGAGNTPDSDGDNTTTYVRVDQNTIRFDFNAPTSQAGGNVRLSVDGFGGVTFAGQDKANYTTTLDDNGDGSITVTGDAATIQVGDGFTVDINGFAQTIVFDRAEPATIDGAQDTYFCQDDATCTVTAVVRDQFGNPVTTGEVEAQRIGAQNQNVDTAAQRKPVGPDGTVEFTFTDANPVDGGQDTVTFEYFVDRFDNTAETLGGDGKTTIKYSATGQGRNFVIGLDGRSTEATDYKATDQAIVPLADAVAEDTTDPRDEDATLEISGGEADQAVTISVDNGALILTPTDGNKLTAGSSSVEATLDANGDLPTGYRVIGTRSGTVTVTVTSANRTETAQLVVSAQNDVSTARNVSVSGPAEVENGTTQIPFVAVVTDAFGNPVSGVNVTDLNVQVTGPAQFQDSDVVTDANGRITLNVRVDSDAEGPVTIKVTGIPGRHQFGAAKDDLNSTGTPAAEGLPASSNVATATTVVEAAEEPEPEPEPEPTQEPISPGLRLLNAQDRDTLFGYNLIQIRAPKADGARVDIFRVKDGAPARRIKSKTLNNKGFAQFKRADLNGSKVTRYYAVVRATEDTLQGRTKTKGIR